MHRRKFIRSALGVTAAVSFPSLRGFAADVTLAAEIQVIKGSGETTQIERTALEDLRSHLRGRVLFPHSDGYDTVRQMRNRMIDKRPALIVQCAGAGDVREAVNFARHYELLTAVRCGGHNVAGKGSCDDGIMIDLSPLQGIRVDPIARTARVAGGSLLGSMDAECQGFGLVTPAGTVSHTGVGGLTLGGGFGRLARKYGLTVDNLKAVDIITADGEFRRASTEENPELYWGVRGGGGNFGVVTSFEFGLHPLAHQVIGGTIMFPFSQAKDLLKFYPDYCENMPDDMYADPVIFAPPGGAGSMVYFEVCYAGPHRDAERVLGPLRRAGKPIFDGLKAIDYVALQRSSDDTDPRGTGQYLKSGFTTEISSDLVDNLVDNLGSHPERGGMAFFQQSGGAIGRVASDGTAFAHRYAQHNMTVGSVWKTGIEDTAPHVRWTRSYWDSVEKFTHGFYANDEFAVSQNRAQKNYLGNTERLVKIKNEYDPTNLFRLNSNIRPTVGEV
jgi:FAD/FMN-containing dehydrogenase